MPLLYLILHATTIFVYCLGVSSAGSNETDRLALQGIKARITHDPLGVLSSWNDSLHFCDWPGVDCGLRHQRVTKLDLKSSKLTGNLSPYVGNLSFLRVLFLDNNSFMGVIPSEIGLLRRLQYLSLTNNSFGGEIPTNISRCSNLIWLSIDGNELIGEIPPMLGSLSNLQILYLSQNHLLGTIPASFGNLTSLSMLDVGENNLIRTIPDNLGRLKNLTDLSLYENKLSGNVPPSIFNLSSLKTVALYENHLNGSLPTELGNMLPNLNYFSIMSNQFTGSIPPSISNSTNLQELDLASNNLLGQVPSLHKLQKAKRLWLYNNSLGTGQPTDLSFVASLANATTLDTLDIGFNKFGGIFPSVICNFSALTFLQVQVNKIAGQIPTCIESLASLVAINARQNQLSGLIPSSIGRFQKLRYINLHSNQFSGHIPSTLGNLTSLTHLILSDNNLEGHIPSTLGNYSYLLALVLSQNNLNGRIPSQLLSISSLSIVLNLSNNPLTGSLPKEVGELINLDVLDVSNAMLSGEIPTTLSACITLEYLYMGGNSFQGPITPALIELRGLRQLDLSWNNFSGDIPKFLVSLPLQALDLSHNSLEGEVPTGGIFSNVSALYIFGNNRLCGGIPELKLPPCTLDRTRRRRLGHKGRSIISLLLGAFVVILVAAFVSLYAFCHKKRRKEPMAKSESALLNLSYQSLVKATNGFSSDNLIGSGAFGAVYKGTLDEDQTTVAIKVFNLDLRGAAQSFTKECLVLRNVRHRNLVKVITVCSSVDPQGNDFKALVYEYMAHGSLEDWLHQKPNNGAEGSRDAAKNLNLLKRLDTAVDVAFALEYLHHHCGATIVHCDLKPSNVLFDDEMVTHVGDFGLAKFLSNGITSSHTNQSSSVGVRGTIGYAPPEYGMGNEPSVSGDAYSFGILLLEMLTGRRPTDNMFKEGLNLHSYVKAALPDHVMEILDQALLKDIVGEETSTRDHAPLLRRGHIKEILEALTSVLGIALSCSAQLPQERLGITEVAAKLSSIRNKLLETHLRRQT